MIAPAVVGLNFRWLFNGQYGLANALLRIVHLPEIPWLSDPNWALASVIIADVWQNTPLMVLLFLAGLQSLPQEPLEAAAVDGASEWNIFWWIVLPLMRPVIMIALMLRITDTFRTFDVVWLMTQGGPGGATNLITVNAYLLASRRSISAMRRRSPTSPSSSRSCSSGCFTACRRCARRASGERSRVAAAAGRGRARPAKAHLDRPHRPLRGARRNDPPHHLSAGLAGHHVPAQLVQIFASPPHILPEQITFSQYVSVFSQYGLASYLWNTIVVSLATVVSVTVLAIPCAYAIARFRLPGQKLVVSLLLIMRIITIIALAIPLFVVFANLGMLDTLSALILTHTAAKLPIAIWLLMGFIQDLPKEIEESALMDGAGTLASWCRS